MLKSSRGSLGEARYRIALRARHAADAIPFLAGMFEQQKKGAACRVRANKDQSGVIILVSRGAYMRTVMQWQGTRVVFRRSVQQSKT